MRSIGFALALLLLVVGCDSSLDSPHLLAKSATFDVYIVSPAKTATSKVVTDSATNAPFFLTTPAFISANDVATVQRSKDGGQSQALTVSLTPAGAAKMAAITATTKGTQIAILVNGTLVSAPKLTGPIPREFQLTGSSDFEKLFQELTTN